MKNLKAYRAHEIREWLRDHYFDKFTMDDVNRKFNVNLTDKELYKIYAGDFVFNMPQFSFYRAPVTNVSPVRSINILQLYNAIKSDFYAGVTTKLRSITDPKEKRKFKAKNFDHFTISGIFQQRNKSGVLNRTFYSIFDFDHLDDPESVKTILVNDPYISPDLAFVSPSGDGLKIAVYDQDHSEHEKFYQLVADYIRIKHPDIYPFLDKSTRDISRTCFICHDPRAYCNKNILTLWQAQRN